MFKDRKSKTKRVAVAIILTLLIVLISACHAGRSSSPQNSYPATFTPRPTRTQPPNLTLIPADTQIPQPPLHPTPSINYPVGEGTPFPMPAEAISPENAGRVIELARWGIGLPERLVWSPNDQTFAVVYSNGAHYYDLNTLEEKGYISAAEAEQLFPSPIVDNLPDRSEPTSEGGPYRAVMGYEKIQILNKVDGSLVRELEPAGQVLDIVLSPDGELLLFTEFDGITLERAIRIVRVSDGSLIYSLELGENGCRGLTFSKDGNYFFCGARPGERILQIWKVDDWQSTLYLEADNLMLSPYGDLVASWDHNDESVKLWRIADGSLLQTLRGHKFGIREAVFSPGNSYLAVVAQDGVMHIWDISSGQEAQLFDKLTCDFNRCQLAFIPAEARADDKTVLIALDEHSRSVKAWHASDGSLVKTIYEYKEVIEGFALSPDSEYLYSLVRPQGEDHYLLNRYRAADGVLENQFGIKEVDQPFLSPDGASLMLVSGHQTSFRLFRLPEYSLITEIRAPSGAWASGISNEGTAIWISGVDGKVTIYNTENGRRVNTISWSDQLDFEMIVANWKKIREDFSPGSKLVPQINPGADMKKECRISTILAISLEHNLAISRLGCDTWWKIETADGTRLARGPTSFDVWNVENGLHLYQLTEIMDSSGMDIAKTPGGLTLAALAESAIKLYDLSNGRLLREIGNPSTSYQHIAFLADGRILTTVTEEYDTDRGYWSVLELWDTLSRSILARFSTSVSIQRLAFSSDSRLLAGIGEDGVMYLWGIGR